jgi:hypothetical protein
MEFDKKLEALLIKKISLEKTKNRRRSDKNLERKNRTSTK